MKKFIASVLAVAAVSSVALPAAAAPWQNINQRQANLEQRINMGVRTGRLSRVEAQRLRTEFRSLERLEARYRYTGRGLSAWERQDLDRRFNALSARIRIQANDHNRR